jgi:hypothetical protein
MGSVPLHTLDVLAGGAVPLLPIKVLERVQKCGPQFKASCSLM